MLHKACSQSDSDHYQANQLVFCLAWLASSSSTVQPRQVNKKISSHRKLWSCYSPIMTHQSLQYILLVYKEAENSKLYARGGNCLFKPCDENALSYGFSYMRMRAYYIRDCVFLPCLHITAMAIQPSDIPVLDWRDQNWSMLNRLAPNWLTNKL